MIQILMPVFWVSVLIVAEACAQPTTVTGSHANELGILPEPPAGFQSTNEVRQAILGGKIKIVDVSPDIPEEIELLDGLECGKGGDRVLKLDLYRPKGLKQPVPVLAFVHGGSWKSGKRGDYRKYGVDFAQRGYVVACVSYRFSREAPFPAAVQDVKCAVRWLRANANRYDIDPDKIAVLGGSAGGHLALMLGFSADVPELEGEGGNIDVSSRVQAVVNLYGPTDLTAEEARSKGPVVEFLGMKAFNEAPDAYRLASPISHVTADDPPTLILHGTIDDVVPISQADMLAKKLQEHEVAYVYDRLVGWPHAMDLSQDVNDRCQWFIQRFLEQHLPLPQ